MTMSGPARRRLRLIVAAAVAATVCQAAWNRANAFEFHWFWERWSKEDRIVLASMHVSKIPAAMDTPGIPAAEAADAARLGQHIFFDPRFSRNGAVSCASCHDPGKDFQDGRELGQGMATGTRRTMPVVAGGTEPFLMWDGRKDSVWSQALGPLENPREHGGTRLAYAHVLSEHYRADYERVFGPMPDLDRLPQHAGPLGTPAEREAWARLPDPVRHQVSQVFANLGKAVAAYENTMVFGPSRLDRFIEALGRDDDAAARLLTERETKGLRIFMHEGRCITCHTGPLFTDAHFHNTGIRPREPANPDPGRAAIMGELLKDEFNCLGPYSGVTPDRCDELRFLAASDPHMLGAFKTPSLRNVAERAPYMHAGQLATLQDVVAHYRQAPAAAIGHSELKPVALSDDEVKDVIAFLGTLNGPIVERPPSKKQ